MATTTPNFGWSVPTSTDLVKDGATAIELLGDSIDASFVDLKGGTTGQVLTKASGTDLDFSFTTLSAGALTLVKSQTIGTTVSSVTVTSAFSATYDNYFVTINGGVASTNNTLDLQLGSTTTGYFYFGVYGNPTSATVAGDNGNNTANFRYVGSGDTNILSGQFTLQNPNLAKRTMIYATSNRSGTGNINLVFNGSETSATQHTDFTLLVNTGTITGGTIRVYGYQNS